MSKYDKFYNAKDYILELVKTELVGPVAENEVLESSPLNTYVCGILWAQPLHTSSGETEDERDFETNWVLVDGSAVGDDDDAESAVPTEPDLDDMGDDVVAKSSLRKPSTMGISVMLGADTTSVNATFSFGTYSHSEETREYGKEGKTRTYHLYARKQHTVKMHFDFSIEGVFYASDRVEELKKYGISIIATRRLGKVGQERLMTFSVSNDKHAQSQDVVLNESALFQCRFEIETPNGEFVALDPEFSSVYDIEDEILAMQYRNVRNYAQGHGCATNFKVENGKCRAVQSEFIPVSEVRQMKPLEVEEGERKLFSLRYLSTGNREEILTCLSAFINKYENWLKAQSEYGKKEEFKRFGRAVEDCLKNISNCIGRLRDGVSCLRANDIAWRSFVLCNQSMYRQRVSMALINGKIVSPTEFGAKMDDPRWYPFQLFYLLMIIPDFVDRNSAYKDVVDLLWFPTGGGKTEAYLAVSAFIIFYERLLESRSFYGTTIIMRYTLRLLTIQQFERASALICACEEIRTREHLGGNEISIGLWIGGGSAPNRLKEAKEALDKLKTDGKLYGLSTPVQITKCPYCGKALSAANYKIDDDGMKIVCDDCGRLPIYIIDDDIYHKAPTLVISTVDKFARIVWEERAGRIFGCNMETNKPKLIIQDELHLISGPLGTLTGLYESAIDKLCQDDNGNKPKIIASTATVKNAAYQIAGLYGRKHFQFPPCGLDDTDSFFAVKATKEEKPSRFYIGLSEQGGSMVDLMIRIYSVLSVADYFLSALSEYDEEVVDRYYTIIGYFNTIKDLGTASTIVRERMRAYISSLLNGKFIAESQRLGIGRLGDDEEEEDDDDEDDNEEKSQGTNKGKYKYSCKIRPGELTSRRNATEVKNILDELKNGYKRDGDNAQVYKYILSSNMFSVGVDIDRLGLMVIYGQPKSNADYIQATGRVGRANPGLVFCLYNAFRSRDRSYYERFNQYHSCLYKYVEPTSVTPFSQRSIEKGLHSVFIALVRHLVPGMAHNEEASKFSQNNQTVQEIYRYLLARIEAIQPDAKGNAKDYLDAVIQAWSDSVGQKLVYNNKLKGEHASQYMSLLVAAEEDPGDMAVLNSVRNVENTSNVFIDF